jgi:hypothetical protein
MSSQKTEKPPIRFSEIMEYMSCPELGRRSSESKSPGNVHTVNGITMALMVETYLSGSVKNPDPEAHASNCLQVAITEEEQRSGKVWMTPQQAGIIIDRCASAFYHFMHWWPKQGLEVVAVEIEVRSNHIVERGGRLDMLVYRPADGKFGILDGKGYGMGGKSVNSQSITPDLNKENQCGWYGAILEAGCTAFKGVPNRERRTLTSELKKKYEHIELNFEIGFYGQILFGHLIPFKVGAKKGTQRGQCLFTAEFHQHLVTNANRLADWYHVMKTLAPSPSVRRYDTGGRYTCDRCRFAKDCWPDANTPAPVATIPDFVNEILKEQP